MDLVLEFRQGILSGEGYDGIGAFVISGVYSADTRECSWKKAYVARHTVEYSGFGEDKLIWGTWILPGAKGGFKIWPLAEGPPLKAIEEHEPEEQRALQTKLAAAPGRQTAAK